MRSIMDQFAKAEPPGGDLAPREQYASNSVEAACAS